MKILSELFTVVAYNADFILLQVHGTHTYDTAYTLQMNGFDGRETFIRISKYNYPSATITFWYSGREPENTLTFHIGDNYPKREEVTYMWGKLQEVLNDLGVKLK